MHNKDEELETWMVVLWNPSVRKCVGIPVPNVYFRSPYRYTRIAFGVCPDTKDPKLVKINVVQTPSVSWEVQVFTLSSRTWKTVFTDALSKPPCFLCWNHVFIDGLIYWWRTGSFVISFDMKSDKFGEVCLSERLAIPFFLEVVKVNDSLGLLLYSGEGEMSVCGVWIRKDGVNKPFTKIYTVKEGKSILGFRNNGEIVIEREDDDSQGSQIEVYEPSSGRTNTVGINGDRRTFTVLSYMETLHLLDESNSIIHS